MALQPTIKLYKDEKSPETILQPFISLAKLKKILDVAKSIESTDLNDINEEEIDKLVDLTCVLFEGKVTREDVEKYADIDDMFDCFLIVGSISKKHSQKQTGNQKVKLMNGGKKS